MDLLYIILLLLIICLYIHCFIEEIKINEKIIENENNIKLKYYELQYQLVKIKQKLENMD